MIQTRPSVLIFLAPILVGLGLFGWSFEGRAGNTVNQEIQTQLGHELARLWCRQCHVVEPEGTGLAQSDAPTFSEVANREGQTAQKLEGFLIDPHPPMPNLNLSRDELRNLSTYILSLRRANSN